ncbi:MAG: glutaminyl-peptide cyclotransferase, partial [Saprospiraceae bacterium]
MPKPINNTTKIIATIIVLILCFVLYKMLWAKEKELRFSDIIVTPDMNTTIEAGKVLDVTFNEPKLSSHDSIVIRLNDQPLTTLIDKYGVVIDSKDLGLGYQKLDIKVSKRGKHKSISLPFVVVSDISPGPLVYSKVRDITHDPKSYTQGIEMHNGILYESAGQYGESAIKKLDPLSGKTIQQKPLAKEYFGEGLTILDGKVYQLTYKEGICIIYDESLNELDKKRFPSTTREGWGLCNDGKSLIISDGSSKLTYVNPASFAIEKIMTIYAGSKEVAALNELEYVNGIIYANIYTTNQIVKIEANTGKVLGVLDMANLKNEN